MATASFIGEEPGRVDGKGRLTVPSAFRETLAMGDAESSGRQPRLRLNYGDHLGRLLVIYTVSAFEDVERRLDAWEPATEEEQEDRDAAAHFLLTQTQALEVDPDGRVVLSPRLRAKLGLPEGGAVTFAGKGRHLEVWEASAYEAEVASPRRDFRERQGRGYNPMTRVIAATTLRRVDP